MKIDFDFKCPNCDVLQTITLPAPEPIYADKNADSHNCFDNEQFQCQTCNAYYYADVWNSMGGAWYYVIDEDGDKIDCDEFNCSVYYGEEEQYDDEIDWWIKSDASEFCEQLQNHLSKGRSLIHSLLEKNDTDSDTKQIVTIMLYGHIVAAFEGYLEMSFVNNVFTFDGALRRYVTSNPEIKKEKFDLSKIFDIYDKIEEIAKEYLKKTIFHNVGKVKLMYENTFNFDFGEIDYFSKAVGIRHDCVHRAGRDKKGQQIVITIDELKELIDKIDEFAKKLETHWKCKLLTRLGLLEVSLGKVDE